PAAGEDPGDLLHAEVLEASVDEAAPALEDGDRVPARGVRAPHDGADDRVQPRAVATAGEHAECRRHRRKSYPRTATSRLRAHDECGGWDSNPHVPKDNGF